ncbi:hypothetical protein GGI42DRAFT_351588 [Trichoderma sp. SZMC 28013]
MSARPPSNYGQGQPTNRHGQGQGQGQRSSRQAQGSSSSNRNNQGYALKEYLKTPHRHETWDWEKKAKDRNDKTTRL